MGCISPLPPLPFLRCGVLRPLRLSAYKSFASFLLSIGRSLKGFFWELIVFEWIYRRECTHKGDLTIRRTDFRLQWSDPSLKLRVRLGISASRFFSASSLRFLMILLSRVSDSTVFFPRFLAYFHVVVAWGMNGTYIFFSRPLPFSAIACGVEVFFSWSVRSSLCCYQRYCKRVHFKPRFYCHELFFSRR